MRLINAHTLELELFPDPVPSDVPYVILSHTWTDDEITFSDMQDLPIAISKASFVKIQKTCDIAISNGLQYVWVDTCCIDKTSSAELSEAINSMFRWYKNALICFAYLFDVPANCQLEGSPYFRDSRWFKRGWTLQELIAPTALVFFDKEWNMQGTKMDLFEDIESITGIDQWVLNGSAPLSAISLAKRMSWAAGRTTTRVEDLAYCLLGIFEVNMPMIYGEGSRAFVRLQEEILKKTTDLSLFAWRSKGEAKYQGILASSPADFEGCGKIAANEDQFRFRDEITMTNKGVKLNTTLQYSGDDVYILDLHCYNEERDGTEIRVGIYLKRALDTYFRHRPQEIASAGIVLGSSHAPVYLSSTADESLINSMVSDDISRRIIIHFPEDSPLYRVSEIKAVPEIYWQANEKFFSIHTLHRFKCFVRFSVTSRIPPPHPNYGTVSEETSQFILVCELVGKSSLRFRICAESGLESDSQPQGFINPFQHIERYTPLGDPFSLSVLSPVEEDNLPVSMISRDQRHNYMIWAELGTNPSPPFRITVMLASGRFPADRGWGLGNVGGRPLGAPGQYPQHEHEGPNPQGQPRRPVLFSGGG
ncbi:heterokaryon incompatibility protein-domain-containing protein [Leptodontidium sp. 2 PMI_412]|nr:heterokaryon incompatibility protein-domain-containing protein [Leptodontidium sp. 2 PMI_412]